MQGSRIKRGMAALSSLALVATMAVATAAPTAAQGCDHSFPPGGGTLTVLNAGEVACGGIGNDTITTMNGGLFRGGQGNDTVTNLNGGKFLGNLGNDTAWNVYGGQFFGGFGADHVEWMFEDAVFKGEAGNDTMWALLNGTFHGGLGDDYAYYDGFYHGPGQEGGRFNGGPGNDHADYVWGEDALFVAGPGNDRVTWHYEGVTKAGLGHDRVDYLYGGAFFGAAGSDRATHVSGTFNPGNPGRFKGGRGADSVAVVRDGGVFNGAKGNDRITGYIYDATFYGGPHQDTANVCGNGNTLVSVENKVNVACPAGAAAAAPARPSLTR